MSHEIDTSTGKAGMAYVGSAPWHGLGAKLPDNASLEVWQTAAGLDWTAVISPLTANVKVGEEPVAKAPVVETAEARMSSRISSAFDELKSSMKEEDISNDLAKVKMIEDQFGRKIDKISDEEIESFFTGSEDILEVDVMTGREAIVFDDAFLKTPEQAYRAKALFDERPESVSSDMEVALQKVINDASLWRAC